MAEQSKTMKDVYLAYLRCELSFEAVDQSAHNMLTNYRRSHNFSKSADRS
jgi:hypothetical protein